MWHVFSKYRTLNHNKEKTTSIADKSAGNLCKKDDRAFWGEIKKMTSSKSKLPSMVGVAHGNDAINTMWQEHYSNIFNSVNEVAVEIYMQQCVRNILYLTET